MPTRRSVALGDTTICVPCPAGTSAAEVAGVDGAAVLSTCNRVEAIVSTRDEDVIESVVDWLAARAGAARTLAGHDDEIDDVAVHVNNTYYRYKCPSHVCTVVSRLSR